MDTENPKHISGPANMLKRFHHRRPPLSTLRDFGVPSRNNVSNSNQEAEGSSKIDSIYCDCSPKIDESRDRTSVSNEQLSNLHVTQMYPSPQILLCRNITRQRGDFIEERYVDGKSIPSKPKLSQNPKGVEAFNLKGPFCAWVPPDEPIFIAGRPGGKCRLEEWFIEARKYLENPNPKSSHKQKEIEADSRKNPLCARVPHDKTKFTTITSRWKDCRLNEGFIEANKYLDKPDPKLRHKPTETDVLIRKDQLCVRGPHAKTKFRTVTTRPNDCRLNEGFTEANKYLDKPDPKLRHKPKGTNALDRKEPLCGRVPHDKTKFTTITTRPEDCRLNEGFTEANKYFDKSDPELRHKPKETDVLIRKDQLCVRVPRSKTKFTTVTIRPGDCRSKEWFIDANKYFDKPNPKLSDKKSGAERSPWKITKRNCPLRALRNVYADYLYDDDYIQSNYHHILEIERQYTLRKSCFQQKFNMVDRQMVVNWIVHITEKLYLEESTMFSAIRMFDSFLVKSRKVEPENYYLSAVTCLWISSKLVDRTTHTIKVYNASARKFNKAQLIATERNILWQLKFDVNYPEPVVILNYYLRRQCLQNNNNVRYAAVFLLECVMLLSEFSSSSPSLLAAAALFLTYLKLGMLVQASLFENFIDDHLLPKAAFVKYSLALFKQVTQQVFCCRNILWNSIEKYSTQDKLKVAGIFISIS